MPRFSCAKWYDMTSFPKSVPCLRCWTYSQILDLTFEICGPDFVSEDIYKTLNAPNQPA